MSELEDKQEQKIENSDTIQVKTIPTVSLSLTNQVNYTLGIDSTNKTVTNTIETSHNDTKFKIGVDAVLADNSPILKFNGNFEKKDDNYTISANIIDNDGAISGHITTSIDGTIGNVQTNVSGNFSVDENGAPTHKLDATATTNVGSSEWAIAVHNDRTDTSLSLDGKRPLLRRDNNPNSDQAIYQEQKEQLEQTGEQYSISLKGGYSNENSSFYTKNSIMANLGKGNFLNFKFDVNKYKTSAELIADLKKLVVQYTNLSSKSEDGIKTKSHDVDFSLKGKKNIYTANWSVETQTPHNEESVRNMSFGAKASLNRTQYGEFNAGLNGELEANITQQGYKFGIDGAYNYYGSDHNSTNDYMVSTKTTLEKNDSGTNFETGLYAAIRFNNCRTIIEPHSVFELSKDSEGNIIRTYSNGIGLYQQLGKNFEDLTAYIKAGRTIFNGGDKQSYSQIVAGLKKKATDKITLNAESTWQSTEGCSGNIGIIISL